MDEDGNIINPDDETWWFIGLSDEEFDARYAERDRLRDQVRATVCADMGLDPNLTGPTHCTCGLHDEYRAWEAENGHREKCQEIIPNFWHKPSDLRVRWYKHVGRSMTCNRKVSFREWLDIMSECMDALLDEAAENEGRA